jgi:dihydropteroate synthase type 2
MKIVGILNVSDDSFSDGGQFSDLRAAIAHGEKLLNDGAHWLDLGAEASSKHARQLTAEEEITRLTPLAKHFIKHGARVAIDTQKAEVMRALCDTGVHMINDVSALSDPAAPGFLALHREVLLVLMYSRHLPASPVRRPVPETPLPFFTSRIARATDSGISRDRLILDPGMGFFLAPTPEPSLEALRSLPALKAHFDLPLYVCTSRKSFLGALTNQPDPNSRGAATLASEIYAWQKGASYIRTHDARALTDALKVFSALSP